MSETTVMDDQRLILIVLKRMLRRGEAPRCLLAQVRHRVRACTSAAVNAAAAPATDDPANHGSGDRRRDHCRRVADTLSPAQHAIDTWPGPQ